MESVPYVEEGFSFSDSKGNYIRYQKTRALPVFINQYPNAVWINFNSKYIPYNAIIYQYINGRAVYYCRVDVAGKRYYGELVPNEGCYVTSYSEKPFDSFQILVK